MFRILLLEEVPGCARILREGLERAGHRIVATLDSALELGAAVASMHAGVVVIAAESPGPDLLGHLAALSRTNPRPVVLFALEADSAAIRAATRAGVSACVVGEPAPEPARVRAIVDAAVARFEEFQRLRAGLEDARRELRERKLIERAKGLIMREKGLAEDAAFHLLRRLAMSRNLRLAEAARQVIEAAELLGKG
jgi:response regulator NasT